MILAVEEINAAGGVHSRKIRLVVEDNGYDPKKAVLATQKLLTQDKVFALVSTFGSATSLASMPLALDRGVPMLFPASSSETAYLPFHPLKFGAITTNHDQIRAAVKYCYEKLGKRRVGVLYQDDESGGSVIRAVETQLAVHGLAPIARASYKRGEINFSAQIALLKAANLDLLVLGTIVRETAGAAIEAKKQDWQVDMLADQSASTTAVIRLGGQAVEGMYVTTQFMNSAQEQTPVLKAVKDRYKARFGREMEDGIAPGYNGIMLFAEGAKNAGRSLTPQSLSQGLEKVKNFTSVFTAPPVSYSPTDHSPPRSTILLQVRDGKFVPITGAVTY